MKSIFGFQQPFWEDKVLDLLSAQSELEKRSVLRGLDERSLLSLETCLRLLRKNASKRIGTVKAARRKKQEAGNKNPENQQKG